MRNENGNWRTVTKVQEVLVAVPSDDKTTVEVMSFKPELLIKVFSAALDAKPNLKKDYRLSVFIPLDDKRMRRTGAVIPGLKAKSDWIEVIKPDDEMLRRSAERFSTRSFIEKVKQEFADLNGVDVSEVFVDFRIRSAFPSAPVRLDLDPGSAQATTHKSPYQKAKS